MRGGEVLRFEFLGSLLAGILLRGKGISVIFLFNHKHVQNLILLYPQMEVMQSNRVLEEPEFLVKFLSLAPLIPDLRELLGNLFYLSQWKSIFSDIGLKEAQSLVLVLSLGQVFLEGIIGQTQHTLHQLDFFHQ